MESAKLVAGDAAELDQFGYAVALHAETAVVGAYGESSYRGAVYVYALDEIGWAETQKLTATAGSEGDSFGWSVALRGDRALVGAYAREAHRGAAYVFSHDGASFADERELLASDGEAGDNFGWSVALSSGRALVGAYSDGPASGSAYVFAERDDRWAEEHKLMPTDSAADDHFGYAVAIDGDRALVGAPGEDSARGAAYVFASADGTWIEAHKLVPRDAAADDHFGYAVAIDGDRALVGAYWKDALRGAAYVFMYDGDSWTEEQELIASDGSEGHRFGGSVTLDTNLALVGAYAGNGSLGTAYVFARRDSAWTEAQQLVTSDGTDGDLFGWSASLHAGRALVGAHYDDNLRGAAYVFPAASASDDLCVTNDACGSLNPQTSGCACQSGSSAAPSDVCIFGGALALLLLARRGYLSRLAPKA